MKPSWIIGLTMIFITGSILSGIAEMQFLGGNFGDGVTSKSVIQQLLTVPSLTGLGLADKGKAMLTATWGWISALFKLITWDYAFFTGIYSFIRYGICFPISAGMVFGIISMFRGN